MPLVKSKGTFAALVALGVAMLLTACGNNPDTAPVAAAAIAINAPDGAVAVMGTMQFSATVTDANGNTIATTPKWTLVNGGGEITSAGLFTAGDSVGTFTNTIVATIGSVTSSSSITVSAGGLSSITVSPDTITLPAGTTHQYTAVDHDAYGHVVAMPGRTWSAASAAGTIDTSGFFTASTTAGTTTSAVTATSGSISGTANVVVSPGALATITLSPDTVTLDGGVMQQFTAVGKDAYGNVRAAELTWSATQGSITSNGLLTAGYTPGTYPSSVTATDGLVTGDATVIVNPGPLYSIVVSPSSVLVWTFSAQPFTATGHDAGGYIVPITPVWSVDPASAAAGTISSSGVFSASSAQGYYGNAIVATSGSITGTASVQVWNPICMPWCGGPPP